MAGERERPRLVGSDGERRPSPINPRDEEGYAMAERGFTLLTEQSPDYFVTCDPGSIALSSTSAEITLPWQSPLVLLRMSGSVLNDGTEVSKSKIGVKISVQGADYPIMRNHQGAGWVYFSDLFAGSNTVLLGRIVMPNEKWTIQFRNINSAAAHNPSITWGVRQLRPAELRAINDDLEKTR